MPTVKLLDRLPWRRPPPPIADGRWRDGVAACPLAQRLARDERERLRWLAARFLQRKRFHPVDTRLDDAQELLIAMQATIPILHRGFRQLRGWQGVIVYPGEFKVRHAHYDAGTGVVTEGDQILAGEAWQIGPLVLSWASVEHDLMDPWAGRNVIVHEIAHKLDMLDGPPDGMPPLSHGLSRRRWSATFQRAYDRLCRDVHYGYATAIDPYATTNAGEYFAVVSEMHFSAPTVLAQAEPDIAGLLRAYYGPSPAPP